MRATWFSKRIEWLGINVTAVYVIQWLLIGNIATALFKTQGYLELFGWFTAVLLANSIVVFIWIRIKRHLPIKPL